MLLWSGPLLLLLCLPEIAHAEAAASSDRVKRSSVKYRRTLDGMNHQIEKPLSLPAVIDFDEPLAYEEMIRIEGRLPQSFTSFNITLGEDHNSGGERSPLHINFQKGDFFVRRIEKGQFVYTLSSRHYAHIENTKSLEAGEKFVIHIRFIQTPEKMFYIMINNSTSSFVKNTYSLEKIEQISFDGDASIEHVEWGGGPRQLSVFQTFPPMQEGRVVITGRINSDRDLFALALVTPTLDKPFYFNVRFNQHRALANSGKEEWGTEENATKFPFDPYGRFDITLLVDTNEVKVLVYGDLIMKFKHRTSNPREDYHGIWVVNAVVTDIIWT
ncbi:hypothetical protein QR680_004040 [Steinernema hermaphroditum]|uniref:Galectin n=1 Tax=Steinernema hermaphroditum TaxID=289476 RepID=A0AA39LT14_9BILA|nr:hypothetical protein QR680_004040 [Steinernema hermaphroditum]